MIEYGDGFCIFIFEINNYIWGIIWKWNVLWKKICYYNINISPLGGLIGKASRCIVLCTFLRNHFDMWKRIWVRLSLKCFNMFTLCKNKCTNWMGWCFVSLFLFILREQSSQTKNEMYYSGAGMDGRNWVALQDRCLYNKWKKSKLKYVCAMSG